jgi:hypothetical protein
VNVEPHERDGDLERLAPAALAATLLVAVLQIRMDASWSTGVLLAVAALPALVVLRLALRLARDEDAARAAVTTLLVAGLVLAGVAIGRLGHALAGDGFTESGGTLTWMLALFCALSIACARRARSAACLLIAALAGVGLLLEAVNWVFGTEDVDVFRALLALSFALLFGAGALLRGRAGTVLVAAAGVAALAGAYVTGTFLGPFGGGGGLGWGWELVTLVEGVLLAVYAAARLEPGPGYLAFFLLAVFVATAAPAESTVLGWPLALALATLVLLGLRRA